MSKIFFSKMEVLAFVEELILDQMATEDEIEWYEEIIWNKIFNRNYTYKKIVNKMAKEYRGE